MSRTALVVLGIITLTLGIVFYIIQSAPQTTPGQTTATTTPTTTRGPLDAAPRDISEIRFSVPGEPRLARHDTLGWVLNVAHTNTSADRSFTWTVGPAKPGELFRLLQPERFQPHPPEADKPTLTNPLTLEIKHAEQSTTIQIATTPLAGRVAVESSNGYAGTTNATLLELLTKPGPESWADTDPFPGFPPTATKRFEIISQAETDQHVIELAKFKDRWRVLRPIAARANQLVAAQTLELISSYRIESFTPTPPTKPVPTLALKLVRPHPTLKLTEGRLLQFYESDQRLATLNLPFSNTVTLSGPPPTSFSTAVRSYLATTATDVLPQDVGAIKLSPKRGQEKLLKRSLDTWLEKPSDTQAETEPINEALTFLTEEPAEPQESFTETDIRNILRIELLGFDGGQLEVLSVGYNADGVLTIRGQNVVWLYGKFRGPPLFNLPSFSDLEPPPGDTPTPQRDTDYPVK